MTRRLELLRREGDKVMTNDERHLLIGRIWEVKRILALANPEERGR